MFYARPTTILRSSTFFAALAITSFASAQTVAITASGFSQHWGTSNSSYDLNGDGTVDGQDLAIFLQGGSTTGGGSQSGSGGESQQGGSGTVVSNLDTQGAATVAAAGPAASDFQTNDAGTQGQLLQVGSGFNGATAIPGPVGNVSAAGRDARAIARWDFIPYRTVSSRVNVAVVAFHMSGIERVSFSANGGPWVDVYEMQRNPQTGVWEYYVTVDPSTCADGRIEVRAIAWPTVGLPRVLQGPIAGAERLGEHSMVLWANAGGSLQAQQRFVAANGSDTNDGRTATTPVRTIAKAAALLSVAQGGNAGGGFINIAPGTYAWTGFGRDEFGATVPNPVTTERWLTVRRTPNMAGDVVFTSAGEGALRTRLLAVHGMRFEAAQPNRPGTDAGSVLWISHCDLRGTGRGDIRQWVDTGFVGSFITQTRISNSANGCNRGILVRDLHVEGIGKDGFVQIPLVLNSTLRDVIRPDGTTWHTDVMQYMQTNLANPNRNVIVYGFKAFDCKSQGFFAETDPGAGTNPWRDFALVNYFSEFSQGSRHFAQWLAPVDHLVIQNCSFVGEQFMFRSTDGEGVPLTYKNVVVRGSFFTRASVCASAMAAMTANGNHFGDGTTFGANATVGDPRFVDPANNDYRPGPNSPLVNRLNEALLPTDSTLRVVEAPANIGSFEE